MKSDISCHIEMKLLTAHMSVCVYTACMWKKKKKKKKSETKYHVFSRPQKLFSCILLSLWSRDLLGFEGSVTRFYAFFSRRFVSTRGFEYLRIANIRSDSRPIPAEVTIETQSTALKSFELCRKSGNMQSPQFSSAIWVQSQSFICHLFS